MQDVKSVTWHPSGEVLVSTSYDDSIKLWVDAHDEWVCHQTLSGTSHSQMPVALQPVLEACKIANICQPSNLHDVLAAKPACE